MVSDSGPTPLAYWDDPPAQRVDELPSELRKRIEALEARLAKLEGADGRTQWPNTDESPTQTRRKYEQ